MLGKKSSRNVLLALLISLSAFDFAAQTPTVAAAHKTQNVVVVMLDGLRWQEIFRGADAHLVDTLGPAALQVPELRRDIAKKMFWRGTAAERRQTLTPFLWSTVAKEGQIFGNRDLGSDSHVTNKYFFSYPGYNETLTGYGDPRIDSNDNKPNPNVTVFEWLNKKPEFAGKVAAFGAWMDFDGIFNKARCGFVVNSAFDPLTEIPATPELALLNQMKLEDPRVWPDEIFDAPTFHTAVEYIKVKKPRLLFLGLGETDDWAHAGSYAQYLVAIHRDDEWLAALWQQLQSMPEYKGTTTLIVLPDHGRGNGLWRDHGQIVANSRETWMAFLGPDTAALGERKGGPVVTESQIAATVAALLGEDWTTANVNAGQKVGAPIQDVLGK